MSNMSVDMHNVVSSEEAINIIESSVKTLMSNPSMAHSLPPILLRGAPGVGKSTIVKDIAARLGIGFRDVRLAEMERVDFAGLPSVEGGTTKWNVPAIWPKEKCGIVLLDEITSAPSDVQVAAYELVLDRRIANSDYKLPDGWFIVAAGNRDFDGAVVKAMSSALANRFMHFEVEANIEDWIAWALAHDIHPSVIGYLRYKPDSLFKLDGQNRQMGWPSPRSWERVSNILPIFSGAEQEDVLRKAVYGLVGKSAGVEFMQFHKINAKFDDVLEYLINPKAKIVIPEALDQRYALCSAAAYLVWNGKNAEEQKKRVEGLFRIALQLEADFATVLMKMAMCGNSKVPRMAAVLAITGCKKMKEFTEKFGDIKTKTEVKL